MFILGIKPAGHDTATALIEGGRIIAASAQERFDRITHSSNFPIEAIKFCLDTAKIDITQVNEIAIPYNYDQAILKLVLLRTLRYLPKSLLHFPDYKKVLKTKKRVINILRKELGFKNKISFLDHHDCHAASSFFCSPFHKAAILTIDGRGEYATTRMYLGNGNTLHKIDEINFPHSLGMLYENVTNYLGFQRNSDEGKVMGLSAYNRPTLYTKFKKIIQIDGGWKFKLNLNFFNHHVREQAMLPKSFIDLFGPPRKNRETINERHKVIASSLQKITNTFVLRMASAAKKIRNDENLCLAGGIALNAVSNGQILKSGLFKNIFIQPAAGDDGSALGAALLAYFNKFPEKHRKLSYFSPYLGHQAAVSDLNKVIKLIKQNYPQITVKKLTDSAHSAAKAIAENKIVGWFQGKAEFGPRALGNRSILADPRNPKMKDIVNKKVKFRESFRPFAPSVLEENAKKYFQINIPLPYMIVVADVYKDKAKLISSVVHVDNTARVQTVSKKQNARYYQLIKEFYKLTKVPLVLNTSFNVKGEPIVNTPIEAVKCFIKSGIDVLYIDHYEFRKQFINYEK